jgi:hypothetical protein
MARKKKPPKKRSRAVQRVVDKATSKAMSELGSS